MEEPAKVIVTITGKNGETYTIELPAWKALQIWEDLKGLGTRSTSKGWKMKIWVTLSQRPG